MSPELIRILQVALGIGMVIFVHEGGHFLAARLCGVRVEVFSLGFGPKVLGFQRKGTLYQLALVPFGGYVRMAGETDQRDGSPPPPDSLHAKNVPQRFLIYSGGVVMNVIFALVCFPLVYHFGVPAVRPVVGATQPGMPAWFARIPEGTRILKVEGRDVHDFMGIPAEVAIAGSDPVTFEMLYPGESVAREVVLHPKMDETNGFYRVGLAPMGDPDWTVEVEADSVAYAAGLRSGDRIQRVVGAYPGQSPGDALTQHFAQSSPLELEVLRDGQLERITIDPTWTDVASTKRVFGIEPPSNLVRAVRPGPEVEALGLREGDRILTVAGSTILRNSDVLLALHGAAAGALTVEVRRDGELVALHMDAFDPNRAFALFEDIALAQDLESTQVLVRPESAAAQAGLLSGDTVLQLAGSAASTWSDIQTQAAHAAESGQALEFEVQRAGATAPIVLAATAGASRVLDYGFAFRPGTYTFRTKGVAKAITTGAQSSVRMLREAMMTLRQMFRQQISPKNL
ncbi:MAG TPA: RIP metalloprotease RseP, partial [Planctomycetota bacterium]|nr:RIP metalloprotease RseP [Planctomycetota bacterium]